MEEEAGSLFDYARSIGLVFPERFFDIADQKGRVVKVTFPDKFGRWEHTPFLYLERCQLLNEIVPVLDIRLEGCIQTERKELSLVTSMQFFAGKHPSSQEADRFVRSLDFEPLKDASDTLDYINHQSRLILRDCHPLNWIKAKRGLIPIDIIPERFLG